jgi:type IV fimbrial biogenesis protein FimT
MYKTEHHGETQLARGIGGFSLIELMTVVAMFGILVAVVSPSFTTSTNNTRVDASVSELRSALRLARSEAVKRAALVAVDPVNAGDWTSGVRVTVDGDGDPSTPAVPTDLLVRQYTALTNASAPVGPTRFVFDPNGMNIALVSNPSGRVSITSKVQIYFGSTSNCIAVNKAGMLTVTSGACS